MHIVGQLKHEVIRAGTCVGCGACVALAGDHGQMVATETGPIPEFQSTAELPGFALDACPGRGIDYPLLYQKHYGEYPSNWLTGRVLNVRTGYAGEAQVRQCGASGGVLTAVLCHLLESGEVEAVIAVRQGLPTPEQARAVICRTRQEILACAQSVYIPVSVLDLLREVEPGLRYAITCLPDAAAALRVLQAHGHPAARQVRFVVGPYTGTALYPSAIRAFLRSKGIAKNDAITRLQWRAGDWPGYLEISLASGATVRTKKVYYNFLIPFFVTQASLQSMDFANEFADLAAGDAWSPVFEAQGGGHSVLVTRTPEIERIVARMAEQGLLCVKTEQSLKASDMHGHMLDFKKRGSWIRNQWRTKLGRRAPDYGYRPRSVPFSRYCVELVISGLFAAGRTPVARWAVSHLPENLIGPLFNRLRLVWKAASRPTKRKGLGSFDVRIGKSL